MAAQTNIEWTDATVNFWWGCTKVGPGCHHCYAEALSHRTGGPNWGTMQPRRKIKSAISLLHRLDNDYSRWATDHYGGFLPAHCGYKRRVFIQSMSDIFDIEVPLEWFAEAWKNIEECGRLELQIVTKRISVVEKRLTDIGRKTWPAHAGLIITVINQHEANRDIPRLLEIARKLHIPWIGLSIEPTLEMIDLTRIPAPKITQDDEGWAFNSLTDGDYYELYDGERRLDSGDGPMRESKINWVICGGESGPNARPMHPAWARSLRDQCAAASIPFFFKQWGEWKPTPSVDIYCHGPDKNEREFPNSDGISMLADGRVCLRDFSIHEHRRRIKKGVAINSRAIEIDEAALKDFYAIGKRCDVFADETRADNPLGYEWMYRVGKRAAGRLLDGREHNEFPEAR